MRVACYIDGFNLYHAIDALNDDRLKWTDLRSLAQSYLRDDDELIRTVFFTAFNTWDQGKRGRHVNYTNALQAHGVELVLSRFDKVQKHCHDQGRYCPLREEKQTDVAIAVEVLSDCYELGTERIVLITSDSDQIPMVKRVRSTFPETVVYLVAPPKRLSVARELSAECSGKTELTAGRLRQHPLPATIRNGKGKVIAARPAVYGGHRA
ncbi:NYN domain-containing protein [Euryhalocaulis caribicus]|uniref:NYN domain-containing protein n=1 Tax=Euryhalocaulis caribicus TaxID=1161401 RepID=UPI0003B61271|nr:NYN domain-containing protein [Euryhalocaulis caribicus]